MVTIGLTKKAEELGKPENIQDFGIRAIDYKVQDHRPFSDLQNQRGSHDTYFITSDKHEAS